MTEKMIVRQNKNWQVGFWATDPSDSESEDFQPVHALHEITPYGMMLASLGSCTAQVVLSYAQNHGVALDEVEFRLSYQRVFKEDCEDCENIARYDEVINEQITFFGDLEETERRKLFKIAHQCPIDKMFRTGIEINASLGNEAEADDL